MKYTEEECVETFKEARRENNKFIERGEVAWKEYCGYDDDNFSSSISVNLKRKKKPSRIYYSNVSTLHPNIFFKTPYIEFSRRFKALNDPVSRRACEIAEMLCEYNLEIQDFAEQCDDAVKDYLVCSRGVLWNTVYAEYKKDQILVDFNVEIGSYVYLDNNEYVLVKDTDVKKDEASGAEYIEIDTVDHVKVVAEHVLWRDFMHTPAKQWKDVKEVYRGLYLNQYEISSQFGKKALDKISFDFTADSSGDVERKIEMSNGSGNLAKIWEKWHLPTKKRYFISDGSGEIIGEKPPTLDFTGFFPCSCPVLGVRNEDSLLPYPDSFFIRLQLNDSHEISSKKSEFREMLKLTGVCNEKYSDEINRIKTAKNGQYVSVGNWMTLLQTGGMASNVENMPIVDIVNALSRLDFETESVKKEIFEITGISDLDRGITDPRETLGAQDMKSDKSGLRLGKRRQKVNRWLQKTLRLNAEAMLELAPDQQIIDVAGLDMTNEIDVEALQLLRDDRLRTFKISIDTDSMLQPEDEKKKQGKIEFMNMANQTFNTILDYKERAPEMIEAVSATMMMVLREFSSGREVEDKIELAVNNSIQQIKDRLANPPPPPPPDPMIEIQKEMLSMQAQVNETNARNKELEIQIRERDTEIKKFDAETKRLKTISDIDKAESDKAIDLSTLENKQMQQAIQIMKEDDRNGTQNPKV